MYRPLLILFVVILIACEEDKGFNASLSGDVIMPLQIGNSWTYAETSFFYRDTVVHENGYEIIDRSIIEHGGEEWEVFHQVSVGNTDLNSGDVVNFYRNSAQGLWNFGHSMDDENSLYPSLTAKYPVAVGDSWSWSFDDSSGGPDLECLSTHAVYSTILGNFTCIKNHYALPFGVTLPKGVFLPHSLGLSRASTMYSADTAHVTLYYAPSIGLIGLELHTDSLGLVSRSALTEYQLID